MGVKSVRGVGAWVGVGFNDVGGCDVVHVAIGAVGGVGVGRRVLKSLAAVNSMYAAAHIS